MDFHSFQATAMCYEVPLKVTDSDLPFSVFCSCRFLYFPLPYSTFLFYHKHFAVQDYAAAIENMLLTIVELGYQSCWVEGHITDEDRIGRQMADILGVPEEYELVCFLPVGIAESEPALPVKKTFRERAWFNRMFGEDQP